MRAIKRDPVETLPVAVVIAILALGLAACSRAATPPSLQTTSLAPDPRAGARPEWRSGDRWVYAWTSGADKGTKTVEVAETAELRGVQYYVVRNADARHYWTLDLHWAFIVQDSKVEARMVPPLPWFVWPLEVGRRWTYQGVYEERNRKKESNDVFLVVAADTVEVPAGRFRALKIVREGSHRDSDQYWYTPEVRSYTRWVGRRGETEFEELLTEYRAAPLLKPESGPSTAPPETK